MERHLLVFISLLLGGLLAHAQLNLSGAEKFSMEEGLSHNTVQSIFQDSKGYLWFGTKHGLNRYDGYNFESFHHEFMDSSSIAGNTILDIVEDHEGGLWFGTDDGLSYYCKASNSFINFFTGKWDEREQRVYVKSLLIDQEGYLWMGTFRAKKNSRWKGILKFKIIKEVNCSVRLKEVKRYVFDYTPYKKGQMISDQALEGTLALYQTQKGQIWAANAIGPCVLNREEDQFERFALWEKLFGKTIPEISNFFFNILEDPQGNIWLGRKSLVKFNPQDSTLTQVCTFKDCGLINAVLVDQKGNIWIGNHYNILLLISPEGKQLARLEVHDIWNQEQINSNGITLLYQDRLNTIWVGCSNLGLRRINELNRTFTPLRFTHGRGENIKSIFINHKGELMSSAHYPSLEFLPQKGTYIRHLPLLGHRPVSPTYKREQALIQAKNGIYYLSLFRNQSEYLCSYDANTDKLTKIFTVGEKSIRGLYEDSKGTLWISTNFKGLWKYSPSSGQVIHYAPGPNSVNLETIQCVIEDASGNIWIGTRGAGLNKLDTLGNFSYYAPDLQNPRSFPGIIVNDMCLDQQGQLWIATKSAGLVRYNPQTDDFTTFSKKQGLASNYIAAIESDPLNHIWFSTINGLSKLDPLTGKVIYYDAKDGLQGLSFKYGVSTKDAKGRMYFGGDNGMITFHPAQFPQTTPPQFLALTALFINNQQVHPGNSPFLTQDISETQVLKLDYAHNSLTLYFSALHLSTPKKNKYAYMLEGLEKDWVITSGVNPSATYSNLPPGSYTFKVKGANRHDQWSASVRQLQIIVQPPYWMTWWFRTLVATCVLAVAYLSYYTRVNRIQKQKRIVESKNLQLLRQHQEITQQRDQILKLSEREKELNQKRLKYFINISHEFRTPITLIMNPLDKLEQHITYQDQDGQKLISIARQNSNRLLRLVNQLLDFRRIDLNRQRVQYVHGDLIAFVDRMLEIFSGEAATHQLQFSYQKSHQEYYTHFDAEKLETILSNLLSNAIKYNQAKGIILVRLDIYADKQEMLFAKKMDKPSSESLNADAPIVCFEVKDTGIGMTEQDIENLFERFYQAKAQSGSSGIGLSLSYELIKLLGGSIQVKSQVGQGTHIQVCIPLKTGESPQHSLNPASYPYKAASLELEATGQAPVLHSTSIAATNPNSSKPSILIVEDNADLRELIYMDLKAHYAISQASDGREGLEKARELLPQLIITDVMMPKMDGMSMTQVLKSTLSTSHIPIIILTAKGEQQSEITGLETGADDYVRKPFNIAILKARVKSLLNNRERLKALYANEVKINSQASQIDPKEGAFIEKAVNTVEAHMAAESFNINMFCREMGMSRTGLHNKLKALTGKSASEFIKQVRMDKAAKLMRSTDMNVSQVALAVGYQNFSYFSQLFKQWSSMPPVEYQKTQRKSTV